MANQTTKVKNGTVILPKEWKEILVRRWNDTILIKKIEEPEFWKTWKKIKPFCRDISKKDIGKAVQWARKS